MMKTITTVLFIFLAFFTITQTKTYASATDNIYGQAWSDDIGWISFNNCTSPTSCSGVGYGVKVDSVTGALSGYAWSDNIGWIDFNQTTGCPIAGCTTAPKINLTTGQFTGFARALSHDSGWDGWINLGIGTNQSGWKEDLSTGKISGAAWGDLNLGWVVPTSLRIIGSLALPDLTLTNPTQTTAVVGAPQTFTSTISNSGTTSTGASFYNSLQIATGVNGAGAVWPLTASTPSPMTALIAGASASASASYTFSTAGTYSIRFCTDNNTSMIGSIVESNENNNCSTWVAVSVSAASCPSGQYYDTSTNTCVNNPTCSAGQTVDPTTHKCVSNPSCPSGQYYDTSTNTCVNNPVCSSGQYLDQTTHKCVNNPTCSAGQTVDPTTHKCVTVSTQCSNIPDNIESTLSITFPPYRKVANGDGTNACLCASGYVLNAQYQCVKPVFQEI